MKPPAILFVALAAISYGVPGSLFKLAQRAGLPNAAILCFSFLCGSSALLAIRLLLPATAIRPSSRSTSIKLVLAGTATALTNLCYLSSLNYQSVAIAAVLLMQSVWLAMVIHVIRTKERPKPLQVAMVAVILVGTVLATHLLGGAHTSWQGLLLGLGAALAYAFTLQFTGQLVLEVHPLIRAQLMSLGAFLTVALVMGNQGFAPQYWLAGLRFGVIVAIFSMVLPLCLYALFMPRVKASVGAITSALELPASILFAWLLLGETIGASQLVGVLLILAGVVGSNLSKS